jgi:ribonuclease HI
MLDSLLPKWNPMLPQPEDWETNLELVPSQDQVAEMLAIKEACEACPTDIPMTIISDSKYSIDGLTKNLSRWEDEGF